MERHFKVENVFILLHNLNWRYLHGIS